MAGWMAVPPQKRSPVLVAEIVFAAVAAAEKKNSKTNFLPGEMCRAGERGGNCYHLGNSFEHYTQDCNRINSSNNLI